MEENMRIIGLNYSSHDAAASLVEDGKVVAACEEERFSRQKHSKKIPLNAIKSCLHIAGKKISEVDRIAFFVDPSLQYKLILSNLAAGFPESVLYIPRGIQLARKRFDLLPALKENLSLEKFPPVDFVPHHTAHAASSFLPSHFDRAAVLTVDGRGEYETAAIFLAEGNKLRKVHHVTFPHSLGYFYSMITKYLGFRQHHDEYKVMGLSAYGGPDLVKKLEQIVHSDSSGGFKLDLSYFDHHFRATKQRELFTRKFVQEFGEPRKPGEKTEQRHADMAFAAQKVTEKAILNFARYARQLTGEKNLCFSGGVALNCLANQRILESGLFDGLFVRYIPISCIIQMHQEFL
jgi:carbamoyltransferase